MIRSGATGPRVVVGVDGSARSRAALLFAAGEARMRRVPLHVVTACHPDLADARDDYAATQRAVLDACAAELDGIELHADVVLGPPWECLVSAARGATLLVVGGPDHAGLARLLLGSTSHAVVLHAPCPVVAVRGAPVAAPVEPAAPLLSPTAGR